MLRTARAAVRVKTMMTPTGIVESVVIGLNGDGRRGRRIGCRDGDGPAYVVEKEFAFWIEGGDEPVALGGREFVQFEYSNQFQEPTFTNGVSSGGDAEEGRVLFSDDREEKGGEDDDDD